MTNKPVVRSSGDPQTESGDAIAKSAADWVVRINRDPSLQADLNIWLAQNPAHQSAYDKASAVWLVVEPEPETRSLRRPGVLIAICSLLIAGVAGSYWYGVDPLVAWRADLRTALHETQRVQLPDGGWADLNADTAIALDFNPAERVVTVLSGEAVFDVIHDPDRPFIVRAGAVTAEALGTVYGVKLAKDRVIVTVIESRVRVRDAQGSVDINQGQAVQHTDSLGQVEVARLQEITAWQEGRVRFDNRPLAFVLEQINAHRLGRVVVLDQTLAERRISGTIPFSAMEHAPDILAQQVDAKVVSLGPLGAILVPQN